VHFYNNRTLSQKGKLSERKEKPIPTLPKPIPTNLNPL
jgi:hypothetical protein